MNDSALLIAAHGSFTDAHSGEIVRQHAAKLRARGIFAEVQECFWRGEPSLRAGLKRIQSKTVFIIPFFIGHGYFVDKVLPQEFELAGHFTRRGDRKIFYSEPVGTHPNITQVILHRAKEICGRDAPDPVQTCLLLAAHGNSKSEKSAAIVHEHAAKIRALRVVADCRAMFMEQEPYLKDWDQYISLPNVICVPFFMLKGVHVIRDVPRLMGFVSGESRYPFSLRNKKFWYAEPIGTDDSIQNVIWDQIRHVQALNLDVV
ncbi:MAG: CbiX/SirB N-terminal domain-containing protein [Verrucomicrobiota bacterium]